MEIPEGRYGSQLDRAYGYALIGLAILAISTVVLLQDLGVVNAMSASDDLRFIPPLALGLLTVFVYGTVLTIKLWKARRPTPLVTLCLMTILPVAVGLVLEHTQPATSDYNILGWMGVDCPRGWIRKEDVFIRRDGSKFPGCINLKNIQQTGELRIESLTSDGTIDPAIEATLRPPKKLEQAAPTANRNSILDHMADVGIWIYAGVYILIPAWWFIKGRGHSRSKIGLRY